MDHITSADFNRLLNDPSPTCLSLFMPTHRAAPEEMRQDVLRYKNLLHQAKAELGDAITPALTANLQRAEGLLGDSDFWLHQGEGLAVFVSAQTCQWYRLPLTLTEQLVVGSRFAVMPLLPCLDRDQTFYVLTLSKGETRLLRGNEYALNDCKLATLPRSLDAALWYMEKEKLQRTRGQVDGGTHGEGEDTREPHAYVREFLLKVDRAVADFLGASHDPVILVGTQPTLGLFGRLTSLAHIASKIDLNPASLSLEDLHQRAWALLPDGAATSRRAQEQYAALVMGQPDRVEHDSDRILTAASLGRVDTLLVGRPAPTPVAAGFHERIPRHLTASNPLPSRQPLERLIQAVLRTGGRIEAISQAQLQKGDWAAIMRY